MCYLFHQQAFSLAGTVRIELTSKVLETFILPIELSTYLNGATSPTRTENLSLTRRLHCHCANVAYGYRGLDLNQRPLGYEPSKLPDCSTLQYYGGQYRIQTDDLLCARQAFYQLN